MDKSERACSVSYLTLRQIHREETMGIHRSGLIVLIGAWVHGSRPQETHQNLQSILALALLQPISITDLQIAL